jgi:hypothetical protein
MEVRKALGSIEGKLQTITERRGKKITVYDALEEFSVFPQNDKIPTPLEVCGILGACGRLRRGRTVGVAEVSQ